MTGELVTFESSQFHMNIHTFYLFLESDIVTFMDAHTISHSNKENTEIEGQ